MCTPQAGEQAVTERPKELAEFRTDRQYYQRHYEDLLREHAEQWVAIYHEQVVGAAADVDDLLSGLTRAGVPTEKAFIEHVTRKDDVFILAV